ncbi:ATP-binding cassette domain-containing protein [Mycoplasmopsis opalescens]|uniref:ATP-binding cassette domain-containing protein n=1 Tax=Mycoplasmopsis opalescens TaxID=114886 RepID=UPI0009FF6581|nr:ATP-binding cassette domain-containing protein [Mycoplasmopsis opalescens]
MMQNNDKQKEPIIEIQGLKKYFHNGSIVNKAVDNISFNLYEGEIVGLIGESGSGKTTVGRSLLRLYDDFNGFVTLNGKVISGKSISQRDTRYLRRNIQMIFQDPHASLNGQKNIFSTLKEPLIVNGIIRERIKDIFSDWKDVKKMFYYTFQERYLNLTLQNWETINSVSKEFFPEWIERLKGYEYDDSLTLEDNFNNFFGYLEEKQDMESIIVNNMYRNTDNLINFYYEKQQDYRDNNLEYDESAMVNALADYKKAQKLVVMSIEQYEAQKKLKLAKAELMNFKQEQRESMISNKNTFRNFASEFKNDKRISYVAALMTYDLDTHTHHIKQIILKEKLREEVKKLALKCKYLTYREARDTVDQLVAYASSFYQDYFIDVEYSPKIKRQLKEIIRKQFKFDSSKAEQLSIENELAYKNKLNAYKSQIASYEKIIKDKSIKPSYTQEQLETYKKTYEEAYRINRENLAAFFLEYKNTISQLAQKTSDAYNLYLELVQMKTKANQLFEIVQKSFFTVLKDKLSKLTNANEKADLKKQISLFHSKISSKWQTLKSFDIETKFLRRDIRSIKSLLGIAFNEKNPTKYTSKKFNFCIKHKISSLLTKTTIYKALEDVGLLKQFAYRYPHEFSGGQRQRIVIARALITQPKVIVADEPIASLDISIQAQVVNLLKDLCEQKNIGLIFIAHDLSMVEYIANRVQIMHLGKIVESGDTAKVYAHPTHPYTINLFKAIPKISNSNEKFTNINFEIEYLKGQQYPNVPTMYQIEDDHYIYGTDEQVKKWCANDASLNPVSVAKSTVEKQNSQQDTKSSIINHEAFDGLEEIPLDIQYTQVIDHEKINNLDLLAKDNIKKSAENLNKNDESLTKTSKETIQAHDKDSSLSTKQTVEPVKKSKAKNASVKEETKKVVDIESLSGHYKNRRKNDIVAKWYQKTKAKRKPVK